MPITRKRKLSSAKVPVTKANVPSLIVIIASIKPSVNRIIPVVTRPWLVFTKFGVVS